MKHEIILSFFVFVVTLVSPWLAAGQDIAAQEANKAQPSTEEELYNQALESYSRLHELDKEGAHEAQEFDLARSKALLDKVKASAEAEMEADPRVEEEASVRAVNGGADSTISRAPKVDQINMRAVPARTANVEKVNTPCYCP